MIISVLRGKWGNIRVSLSAPRFTSASRFKRWGLKRDLCSALAKPITRS